MEDISDDDFINVPPGDEEFFQKFWINLTNYSHNHFSNKNPEPNKNIDFVDENSRKRFKFILKKKLTNSKKPNFLKN